MAKNKNRQREVVSPVVNVAEKIPLVSVIIPMYNSAKFIPQTLESLLYQTMKNFEVVVIDDCSTDNSVEVVESFTERFGGRLHVVKLPKNTGTPGLPRNVGIQFARGKYISFLDSDDLYTKTALEELSTLAENYQADVVHMYSNYTLWGGKALTVDDPAFTNLNELINPKNFAVLSNRKEHEKIATPTLEPEAIGERIRHWVMLPPEWSTWLSFCRRDFLITNQILFPNMENCEDAPFSFEMLCLAKKYLVVPNITYIIRPRLGSAWRYKGAVPSEKAFHKDMVCFKGGFIEFARIMDNVKFFAEHPDYRYAVLNWFANTRFEMFMNYYASNSPVALTPFVEREFSFDDKTFAAYLFNTANVYRIQIMRLKQELAKFHKQ